MGKNLRQEHIDYFTNRMRDHDKVLACLLIPNDDEYLFRVTRTLRGSQSDVLVHLTDAYQYGLADLAVRPSRVRAGSYVVIGIPHASPGPGVVEEARGLRIGVGRIGKFMGALNYKNIWEYMTPDEKKRHGE